MRILVSAAAGVRGDPLCLERGGPELTCVLSSDVVLSDGRRRSIAVPHAVTCIKQPGPQPRSRELTRSLRASSPLSLAANSSLDSRQRAVTDSHRPAC